MSNEIKEILTDIKAAARLGHIEALQYALDGLLDLPGVAANSPITTAFILQALLPIARVLAQSPVTVGQLSPLGSSDYAVSRALFCAFCAYRYFGSGDIQGKQLQETAKDPRQDVRTAISAALLDAGGQDTEKLAKLSAGWIRSPSPRVKAVGLGLLARSPDEALAQLASFDAGSDPEILAAVAELISAIAQGENIPRAFSLLASWVAEADQYAWVICKTLSSPWAAASPNTAMNILFDLEAHGGKKKQINNALKALAQHDETGEVLAEWNERLKKMKPD